MLSGGAASVPTWRAWDPPSRPPPPRVHWAPEQAQLPSRLTTSRPVALPSRRHGACPWRGPTLCISCLPCPALPCPALPSPALPSPSGRLPASRWAPSPASPGSACCRCRSQRRGKGGVGVRWERGPLRGMALREAPRVHTGHPLGRGLSSRQGGLMVHSQLLLLRHEACAARRGPAPPCRVPPGGSTAGRLPARRQPGTHLFLPRTPSGPGMCLMGFCVPPKAIASSIISFMLTCARPYTQGSTQEQLGCQLGRRLDGCRLGCHARPACPPQGWGLKTRGFRSPSTPLPHPTPPRPSTPFLTHPTQRPPTPHPTPSSPSRCCPG